MPSEYIPFNFHVLNRDPYCPALMFVVYLTTAALLKLSFPVERRRWQSFSGQQRSIAAATLRSLKFQAPGFTPERG